MQDKQHRRPAPARDGQEGKPITLSRYKNEQVRIDVAGTDWGVTNNGFSYIVFDGFEIFGGTRKPQRQVRCESQWQQNGLWSSCDPSQL